MSQSDYVVVKERDLTSLMNEVRFKMVNAGFECTGGVAILDDGRERFYTQAMVKNDPDIEIRQVSDGELGS